MNEYKNAVESFEAVIAEGLEINHSGFTGTVYTLKEYEDVDSGAEEHFSNHLDSEGLELLTSLQDVINGSDLTYVLEEQALNSFINGQFKQFNTEFCNLDTSDFFSYLESEVDQGLELKILRYLCATNL